MKLKEFLRNMGHLCTKDELTAKRIGLSAMLDYMYEIENPESDFAMTDKDKENPKQRIEHAFLFKHLPQVDTKKAERCELCVYLISLRSYKKKYKTDLYDTEILNAERKIASDPIPEIDQAMSVETMAGGW